MHVQKAGDLVDESPRLSKLFSTCAIQILGCTPRSAELSVNAFQNLASVDLFLKARTCRAPFESTSC